MTAAEKEYATALYQLSREENQVEEIREGLALACQAMGDAPEYVKLLQNPALPKAQRLELLDEAFRDAVPGYVLNFLKILCEKSALGILDGCRKAFLALYYEERNILPVTATSAQPLSEAQRAGLKEKLGKATGKTVLLNERVDETLLGGMKVEYAGKELDGSVAGRMERLRRILLDERA